MAADLLSKVALANEAVLFRRLVLTAAANRRRRRSSTHRLTGAAEHCPCCCSSRLLVLLHPSFARSWVVRSAIPRRQAFPIARAAPQAGRALIRIKALAVEETQITLTAPATAPVPCADHDTENRESDCDALPESATMKRAERLCHGGARACLFVWRKYR